MTIDSRKIRPWPAKELVRENPTIRLGIGAEIQILGNAGETRNARVLPDFLAKYEPTHYYTAEPPSNFHGTKIDWLEAVYKYLCNEHEALKQLAKYTKESLVV